MKRIVFLAVLTLSAAYTMACASDLWMNQLKGVNVPVIEIDAPTSAKVGVPIVVTITSRSICTGQPDASAESDKPFVSKQKQKTMVFVSSRYKGLISDYNACTQFTDVVQATRSVVFQESGTWTLEADNRLILETEYKNYTNLADIPQIATTSIIISE